MSKFVVCRLGSGEEQVGAQGVVEDVGVLGDDPDQGPYVVLGVPADVAASDGDFALCRVPEAQDEAGERALSRPAGTDDRDPFAPLQRERDVFEGEPVLIFVAEAHPVELEFVVLGYGEWRCGVLHLGFGVHDLEEAFSCPDGTAEELEGGAERLHGLEATEHDERQEGQVHAPHLSSRDQRDRKHEHREHGEVHQEVAEGVLEPVMKAILPCRRPSLRFSVAMARS